MSRSKQQPRSNLVPRPKSQKAAGKLRSFRPMPYHVALSRAARLETWLDDIDGIGGPPEAMDSSDFDPRLMERQ